MEHMKENVDVLVIGGGTAGTIAAVQAGRSVSSDRLANSALRVQASSMAMGQAVGAAAALSVRLETTPREVPISDLRELLLSHGAVVPGLDK